VAVELTEPETSPFATVEEAIEEIRAGRFVVVCDDADRENEGDLTIAAEFATPAAVNFMATYGLGEMGGTSWGGLLADLTVVPYADAMLVEYFRIGSRLLARRRRIYVEHQPGLIPAAMTAGRDGISTGV
jgi:hypothetical protein